MRRDGIKRRKVRESMTGWLFISPMLVGTLLFLAFPLVYAIIISFTDFHLFDTPVFCGFDNYVRAFHDDFFMSGMLNILITCLGIPVGLVIALVLTNLLVSNPKCSIIFKAIYYVPTICGAVAITFIWQWLYAPMYGLINDVLISAGYENINFLGKEYFLPSMIVMGVWSSLGTSILLLFASLKSVSKQLYEAASIDGANFYQKFTKITLPAVSPTTFYILITSIIGTLQEFTRFKVMRSDIYTKWCITPAWWIYNHTTGQFGYDVGYASAMGIILGVFILIIAAIQFIASRLWVNYDS